MANDKFVLGSAHSHALEMAMNRPENGEWDNNLCHFLAQGGTLGVVRNWLLGNRELPLAPIFDIDRSNGNRPDELISPYFKNHYQNPQSSGITKLDLSRIEFVNLTRENEHVMCFKTHAKRVVEEGYIPLDAKCFEVIWRNRQLLPPVWFEDFRDEDGLATTVFEGTTFRNGANEFVLTIDTARYSYPRSSRDGSMSLEFQQIDGSDPYRKKGFRTPVLRPA